MTAFLHPLAVIKFALALASPTRHSANPPSCPALASVAPLRENATAFTPPSCPLVTRMMGAASALVRVGAAFFFRPAARSEIARSSAAPSSRASSSRVLERFGARASTIARVASLGSDARSLRAAHVDRFARVAMWRRRHAPDAPSPRCAADRAPRWARGRARRDRARRDGARAHDARDAASRDEIATLERQLRALNLERRAVEADGNCFFRALADRRYGDESRHAEVRRRVVAHVEARREVFAPFVEDDETFDEYVERMARDGEWAGHLEVNAATAELRVGICIHQAGSPRWVAGADARGRSSEDVSRVVRGVRSL